MIWTNAVLPAIGIPPGSVAEALSVPFQQTARYMRDAPEDVTEAEYAAIDGVLNAAWIAEGYESYRSDNVKFTFREESTTAQRLAYARAWFAMFWKHPGIYVESLVSNSYGYFSPNVALLADWPLFNFHTDLTMINTSDWLAMADVRLTQSESLAPVRTVLKGYYDVLDAIPPFSLLTSWGSYTLLLVGITVYILQRAKRFQCGRLLVGLIPMWMTLLVCIASPVNGRLIYYFPVIACMPLALAAIRRGLVFRFSND
jgi:hypothetical protein